MAGNDPDILYVSGLVAAIFRSPTWVSPISTFVDDNCGIFEDQEENKLEYTLIHNAFKKLIDELLEAHLIELNVTEDQFTRFAQHGLTGDNEFHRELVEQLLSVDDFLVFKAMMVKRNAQLYRQAMEMFGFTIQQPSAPAGDAGFAQSAPPPDMAAQALAAPEAMPPAPDYSEHLAAQQRLESEAAELEAEKMELHRKCVEAELQLAMALSLQLKKRLQLMEALSEVLEAIAEMREGAEGQLAAEAAASEAREEAPLHVEPMYAVTEPPQPLAGLPGGLLEPSALSAEAQAAEAVQAAEAAEAARQRERAQHAMEVARQQAAAKAAAEAQLPSQDERRARAEHLKRQRDMLVEKKKREREAQLNAHEESARAVAAPPSKAVEVARAWQDKTDRAKQLRDELSGQAPEPAPVSPVAQDTAAAEMRRMLIRQLKTTF